MSPGALAGSREASPWKQSSIVRPAVVAAPDHQTRRDLLIWVLRRGAADRCEECSPNRGCHTLSLWGLRRASTGP